MSKLSNNQYNGTKEKREESRVQSISKQEQEGQKQNINQKNRVNFDLDKILLENEQLKKRTANLEQILLDLQNFLLNEGLKIQMKAKLGPYLTDNGFAGSGANQQQQQQPSK